MYPAIRRPRVAFSGVTTTDAPIGRLDIFAIVKANQAVSQEIILDNLIKTLLTVTLEAAGAERGLLILFRYETPSVAAEATTKSGQVEILLRHDDVSSAELPMSALQYALRTKEILILGDAFCSSEFSGDDYVRRHQSKSILLLPIVKQGKLGGILYLENNLTAYAFTSDRVALLEMLSSQAAISLENASLYAELRRSEAFLAEGQRHSSLATWTWNVQTGELRWSAEHFHLFGLRVNEVKPTFALFLDYVHPEDRAFVEDTLGSAVTKRVPFSFEFRGSLRLGEARHFLAIGREMDGAPGNLNEYMGTLIDISERKRGAQALLNAQEDFRRVSQLIVMGELAASIAHEVTQPIAAMVTNANACLRWLVDEKLNIGGARKAAQNIVTEGHRAGDFIKGIYRLAKKHPIESRPLDISVIIHEVVVLCRSELDRKEVILRTDLHRSCPIVYGDGVQLRQVILNVVRNSIEAMSSVDRRPRYLHISTKQADPDRIEVVVEDNGPGLDPSIADRIFEPFTTTKPEGLGMGLSICRTIIESHGGSLWLSRTGAEGTIVQFSLPAGVRDMMSANAA